MASESTDLVALRVLTPAVVFVPGGVDKIIGQIEAEVRAVKTDISTKAGREAIGSLAYKVARSKTALDDMGKALAADWKARAAASRYWPIPVRPSIILVAPELNSV